MNMFLQSLAVSRREGGLAWALQIYHGVYSGRGTLVPCWLAYLWRDTEGITDWFGRYLALLIVLNLAGLGNILILLVLVWGLPGWNVTWRRLCDQTVDRLLCLSSVFLPAVPGTSRDHLQGLNEWVYPTCWLLCTLLNISKLIKRSQSTHNNCGHVSWLF